MNNNIRSKLRKIFTDEDKYSYKYAYLKDTIDIDDNPKNTIKSTHTISYNIEKDVDYFTKYLQNNLPFFNNLSENRQNALIDLCFNLGASEFMKYEKMIKHLKYNQYESAADEIIHAQWARKIPNRAQKIHHMILEG